MIPRGPGAAAAHPRISWVLGPPDAHNAPGPRGGHRVSHDRETFTCKANGRSRWEMARAICPARRLEEAPEDRRTGAACAELRSPARTAAAARRLLWSSAPQPLLSHGRGALAGRRSRLPAPGSRTPATSNRSPKPHAVRLRAHRAPFPRAPASVSSLPGIRRNPWGTEISRPCPRGRGPPRVQSSRGGSVGQQRRGQT